MKNNIVQGDYFFINGRLIKDDGLSFTAKDVFEALASLQNGVNWTVINPAVIDETTGEIITKEAAILWGSWMQTVIDFLIIALCIFIVVQIFAVVQNKLKAKQLAQKAEEERIAKEKADEEKRVADAVALQKAEEEKAFRASIMAQENLLKEILQELKNK